MPVHREESAGLRAEDPAQLQRFHAPCERATHQQRTHAGARAATCSPTVWPRSAASSDESTARMNSFEVAAPGAGAAATLSSASAAAQSTYL